MVNASVELSALKAGDVPAEGQVTATVKTTKAVENVLNPPFYLLRGGLYSTPGSFLKDWYLHINPIMDTFFSNLLALGYKTSKPAESNSILQNMERVTSDTYLCKKKDGAVGRSIDPLVSDVTVTKVTDGCKLTASITKAGVNVLKNIYEIQTLSSFGRSSYPLPSIQNKGVFFMPLLEDASNLFDGTKVSLHKGFNPGFADTNMQFGEFTEDEEFVFKDGYVYRVALNSTFNKIEVRRKPLGIKVNMDTYFDNSEWKKNTEVQVINLDAPFESVTLGVTNNDGKVYYAKKKDDTHLDLLTITCGKTSTKAVKTLDITGKNTVAGKNITFADDSLQDTNSWIAVSGNMLYILGSTVTEGASKYTGLVQYNLGTNAVAVSRDTDVKYLLSYGGIVYRATGKQKGRVTLTVFGDNTKVATGNINDIYFVPQNGSGGEYTFIRTYEGVADEPWLLVKTNADEKLHLCFCTVFRGLVLSNIQGIADGTDKLNISLTITIK